MLRLKKKIAHSPSISPLHFSGDNACYNTEKPHESVGACGEIIDIHSPIAPESLVSNDTFAGEINGPKVASSPSEKLSLPPRIVSFTASNELEQEAMLYEGQPLSLESTRRDLTTLGHCLLSLDGDSENLNSLHCFVRRNTQVFLATKSDAEAPAPGRKKKIMTRQVGLRCIHCMHMPTQDRVKRAVCYPSSVSRIYHSISDMKFDHFAQCTGMSYELKDEFNSLKQKCCKRKLNSETSSSRSTARYYFESASRLGIVEKRGGLFLDDDTFDCSELSQATVIPKSSDKNDNKQAECMQPELCQSNETVRVISDQSGDTSSLNCMYIVDKTQRSTDESIQVPQFQVEEEAGFRNYELAQQDSDGRPLLEPRFVPNHAILTTYPLFSSVPQSVTPIYDANKRSSTNAITNERLLLSMEEDPLVLNDLHCFIRKNIEFFAATKEDLSSPSPGRRNKVSIGQVGIRCIHCSHKPFKERTKRAICYPPTVHGVYHSVSNMKFDHFEVCKGITEDIRIKLRELKNACKRKGGSRSRDCTAQYYFDSARKLGLVDSRDGIRFSRPNNSPASDKRESRSMCKTENQYSTETVAYRPGGIEALALAASQAAPVQNFISVVQFIYLPGRSTTEYNFVKNKEVGVVNKVAV